MQQFDRSSEDVGNVLSLEHVNLTVPDQGLATVFYVTGLGFTRDPYIDFGLRNVWINAGRQQFHLPTGDPQVFRGSITVVVPDLDDLEHRLTRVSRPLAGTRFDFERHTDHIAVRCPWGNALKAFAPPTFGTLPLGIPRLEVSIAPGHAAGIARFYERVLGCPAHAAQGRAAVRVGPGQSLEFVETNSDLPAYDGHHVAIYVSDFSGPHTFLADRGLVTEESNAHQYRFQAIVDPDSGSVLSELEHEVRALTHPMYARPLVNRNPAVGFANYQRGQEVLTLS